MSASPTRVSGSPITVWRETTDGQLWTVWWSHDDRPHVRHDEIETDCPDVEVANVCRGVERVMNHVRGSPTRARRAGLQLAVLWLFPLTCALIAFAVQGVGGCVLTVVCLLLLWM